MCAKRLTEDTPLFDPSSPLAIIAGTGDLPVHIIEARNAAGYNSFIIAIEGNTPEALVADMPHLWCRIGAVGKAIDALREQGIEQLVLAGNIKRPSLKSIMPDALGAKLLKRLGVGMFAGDDRILSIIVNFFEEQGFHVFGAHDVCHTLAAPQGIITTHQPSVQDKQDIQQAIALLSDLSAHDVGQAAIVQQGYVLGIEAVEGTAALIERAAKLSQGEGGVLVKMPKAGQELRADMPAVGTDTIHALHEGGFHGLAIGANATLMLGKEAMIAQADAFGIFIEGFAIPSSP